MAEAELAMVAWKEQFEPKNWKSRTEKCEANVRAEKLAGSSCTLGISGKERLRPGSCRAAPRLRKN